MSLRFMNGSIINGRDNILTENGPSRRPGIRFFCFIPKCYLSHFPGIIFASLLEEVMEKTGEATYRHVL
jgi:hypothetical protein